MSVPPFPHHILQEQELSGSRQQLLALQQEVQGATTRWHDAAAVLERTMYVAEGHDGMERRGEQGQLHA